MRCWRRCVRGLRVERLLRRVKRPRASATRLRAHAASPLRVPQAPVFLAMKGTPSEPRCKFSRAAVEALTRAGAGAAGGPALGSVDVLSSPAVRQGLKDKFDWPTFPMVFLTRFLGPDMKARGAKGDKKSAIINMTSYYSEFAVTNAPLYSSAKAFEDVFS